MRGSREISLVPSLHRASTDALITSISGTPGRTLDELEIASTALIVVIVTSTKLLAISFQLATLHGINET